MPSETETRWEEDRRELLQCGPRLPAPSSAPLPPPTPGGAQRLRRTWITMEESQVRVNGAPPQLLHSESMRSERRALITPPSMATLNPAAGHYDESARSAAHAGASSFATGKKQADSPRPSEGQLLPLFAQGSDLDICCPRICSAVTPTNPRSPRVSLSGSMSSHCLCHCEERLDKMMVRPHFRDVLNVRSTTV